MAVGLSNRQKMVTRICVMMEAPQPGIRGTDVNAAGAEEPTSEK
jgi:hypothetical protein